MMGSIWIREPHDRTALPRPCYLFLSLRSEFVFDGSDIGGAPECVPRDLRLSIRGLHLKLFGRVHEIAEFFSAQRCI
jgi:hypothetical protein